MGRFKGNASLVISAGVLLLLVVVGFVLDALPSIRWFSGVVIEPKYLLPALNFIFLCLTSYVVAYLIMKSYLISGSPAMPYLMAGMLALGTGSLLSGLLRNSGGPNVTVTISSMAILLLAVFNITAIAIRLVNPRARIDLYYRGVRLGIICGSVVLFMIILSIAAVQGLTPSFFIQGMGPTPIRQSILGASLLMLVISCVSILVFYFQRKIHALYWYALALGFVVAGTGYVYLQVTVGGVMGWIGRCSHYAGGVYFLVAASSALRSARTTGILFTESLSDVFQRSEKEVSTILDSINDCYYEMDRNLRFTRINEKALAFFGKRRDEVIGRSIPEVFNIYGDTIIPRFTGVIDQRTPDHFDFESVITPGAWVELNCYPTEYGISVYFRNISERKRAEDKLLQANRNFSALFNNKTVGLSYCRTIFDEHNNAIDYLMLDVNPTYESMTGVERSRIVGKKLTEALPGVSQDLIDRHNRVAVTGQESRFEIYDSVTGNWYEVDVFSPQKGYFIALFFNINQRKQIDEEIRRSRDELEKRVQERTAELSSAYEELQNEVTQREETEDRLRQSQKMEAIGTLSGGIAHDFNNILAGILGFTEMALEDAEGQPQIEKSLSRVLQSAKRGRDLVKQILLFSRKTGYDNNSLSITPIILETVKLLRASIPSTIQIDFSSRAKSDTIVASPTEVQQILMNLATNASIAMEEKGGTLEITLSDAFHPYSPDIDASSGEFLQLTVTDTGVGMTPEVLQKAFDPFFTTREPGKGTGMGLAVVYGIVRSLNGDVTVTSAPGEGTTFRIFLPKARLENDTIEEKSASEPKGGKETILFVEDEELLNEWGKTVLEKLGYTLMAFRNPEEALQTFSLYHKSFDLVITDQSMPRMSGTQLSTKIRSIQVDIPVILCTGNADLVSPEKARKIGITEVILKPLTKNEFATAVRRVLDARKFSA